ncbi:methyltransferase domain-containing protein [Solibacillus silvestris]
MEIIKSTEDQWNASLYDRKHSFVSKYGNNLVELLNPKEGERILDLGCGTGDIANTLFEYGVEVVGVDKSENMVKLATSKYPHIPFTVRDATQLTYQNEFDAVFSNATLHWVHPPNEAVQSIYQSLKHGGRLVAEFGGKGNVKTITSEIIKQIKNAGFEYNAAQFPWYYPSIAEYSKLMEEAGFNVTFAQLYDRPTPLDGENGLRNWIDMFGSVLFDGIPEQSKDDLIDIVEMNLKEVLYYKGTWMADYKRIRVVGTK